MSGKKIDARQIAAEHVVLRETLVELFNATAYMENAGKQEMRAIGRAREVLKQIEALANRRDSNG